MSVSEDLRLMRDQQRRIAELAALFKKYIAHVEEMEGTTFIPRSPDNESFTEEEWATLQRMDMER